MEPDAQNSSLKSKSGGISAVVDVKPAISDEIGEPEILTKSKMDSKERALVRKLDYYIMVGIYYIVSHL